MLAGAVGLILVSVPSTFGAVITQGQFAFGGFIYVTAAQAGSVVTPGGTCPALTQCIFWQDPAGTTLGKVDISASGNTTGQAIGGNDAANVSTLTDPPDVVGTFPPQTFMTFNNGGGTTTLMINTIFPGIDSPAACSTDTSTALSGQTCTPPGSFVNFQNNPPPTPSGTPCGSGCQATATFAFQGVTSGNPNPQSTWTGNFTAQFALGTSYQAVLNTLQTQGWVSNSFSGTITLSPAVPEPDSVVMIGGGLIGLAVFLRHRSRIKVRT